MSKLLLLKWKFHQLYVNVIVKHDLMSDCWLIQYFRIFSMILTCWRCETSTNSWYCNNLISNHVFQWHSKTIGEIFILKGVVKLINVILLKCTWLSVAIQCKDTKNVASCWNHCHNISCQSKRCVCSLACYSMIWLQSFANCNHIYTKARHRRPNSCTEFVYSWRNWSNFDCVGLDDEYISLQISLNWPFKHHVCDIKTKQFWWFLCIIKHWAFIYNQEINRWTK